MTTTDEPSAADQRRLATILLAGFDDDAAACDQAAAEIEAQPGGWREAYAVLSCCYVNLLIRCSGGEANARRTLEAAAWDASLAEDRDE